MDRYYIGVDLGGTNLKAAAFNRDFIKTAELRTPTEANLGSRHVLHKINDTIALLLCEHHLAEREIECIGIGVPGILDIENGISKFSPNFHDWEDVRVVKSVEERFRVPAFIDNDVRVNLYGEWYLGAGKGKKNVVLLTLGTGLGAGVVIDGRMLYGATSSVGEIGHMNMYREGRPCKCGSFGCLGRYVSALGMIRTVKEKLQDGQRSILCDWVQNDYDRITAQMISEAYDMGDAVAVHTLQETGELLGYGLVNVINLYNPEVIILGGGMAGAGERLLSKAREVVDHHALRISNAACTIVTAALGDAAGMVGAAIYAKQRLERAIAE